MDDIPYVQVTLPSEYEEDDNDLATLINHVAGETSHPGHKALHAASDDIMLTIRHKWNASGDDEHANAGLVHGLASALGYCAFYSQPDASNPMVDMNEKILHFAFRKAVATFNHLKLSAAKAPKGKPPQ